MKIAVIGAGYVGAANGVYLAAKNHQITFVDTKNDLVVSLNTGTYYNEEVCLQNFYRNEKNNISATTSPQYCNFDVCLICIPTDLVQAKLDTFGVSTVIGNIRSVNPNALIVIRSTLPSGFMQQYKEDFNIAFMPEFIREGYTYSDTENPSRVVIGATEEVANSIAKLYGYDRYQVVSAPEAELIKLFSNSYLAMRVAFFNELEHVTTKLGVNTLNVISGVCADPRIGEGHNNPSFGFGGYCLPKDLADTANITDGPLLGAVLASNAFKIETIAQRIFDTKAKTILFYGLTAKFGSKNISDSASIKVLLNFASLLYNSWYHPEIYVYEPTLEDLPECLNYCGYELNQFVPENFSYCDVVVANRVTPKLLEAQRNEKFQIVTCDIYGTN